SYVGFLKYSSQRNLRERMWKAFNSRSFRDSFDNEKNVLEILTLRQQRAKLLGYPDHPSFVLSERMAENPKTVISFLERLLTPSKKAALKDLEEMKSFAAKQDGLAEFKPWDAAYYSEKLKAAKFQFNEEELRPYFKLENVLDGVFVCAEKLYGLTFKQNKTIPVYHEEVNVYEVYDKQNKFVSLFYTDFFPRPTKRPGAWMTLFREQGLFHGKVRRPHVANVCNLTKSTAEKPSLLTYDEVRTVFHEFGHALHGMLSQCTYRGVAGTNVYWDFVELPSQIMENWAAEKEGLDVFAKHHETQELLPPAMVEKIKKVNQFQAGTISLRQVQFGLLDMRVHLNDPSSISDLEKFAEQTLADARIVPRESGTSILAAFSHIFAGGYSA
ncbi:MAG: M3 family metallopeptidase, partial [Pseudobdellovibrionaceae bacterium]